MAKKKLPKGVQQLKSGMYRARVVVDGKRYSFTDEDAEMAAFMANDFKLNNKPKPSELTVSKAIEEYINSKKNVLSPSTIRGYTIMQNNAFENINRKKMKSLNLKQVQIWVNENSAHYKEKSIKNQIGFLSAVCKQNDVILNFDDLTIKAKLPKDIVVPTKEQMGKIIQIVEGTNVEIQVLFALLLGLRQSEIANLKWENYDGQTIKIKGAKVPNSENKIVVKETNKSRASTRTIDVPDYLISKLNQAKRKNEYISNLTANGILVKLQNLCVKNKLPKFTMHALRHANASVMLLEGVPDKYAMERLGQSTPYMLRKVYQHTFKSEQKKISDKMNSTFNNILMDTKTDTKSKS